MTYLVLDGLTRRFGTEAGVFDLSLSLAQGRTLALLGPSGSGKTTTLRLLGGFEAPDAGRILVDGTDVARERPERRRFGMVFQHYALFPHLDVGENIAFGLESLGLEGPAARERVAEALRLVDLAGFERRKVGALSGGQQQRVALARAMAPEPRVLLLDEPLSNLDPALRERTRGELRALIHRVGITTVIVTHEQDDAFDLGDQVAVLDRGRLQQVGTPEELYHAPATPFVAGFIGRGAWLGGQAGPSAGRVRVEGETWEVAPHGSPAPGDPVRVLVRPEALRFVTDGAGLGGRVRARRFAGAVTFYRVQTADGGLLEVSGAADAAQVGDAVCLAPRPGQVSLLHAFPQASA